MNRRLTVLLAGGVVGALAFAAPGLAASNFKNKYSDTTVTRNCGDGDTVVYGGPLKMWPPNHKLQNVDVTATDGGDDGSDVTALEIADNVTDMSGGDGGPNHDPDVMYPAGPAASGDPSATVPLQLRSERSGRGDGRTYTINWVAEFDGGSKVCTSADEGQSPFVVTVPHDMRGGADWKN